MKTTVDNGIITIDVPDTFSAVDLDFLPKKKISDKYIIEDREKEITIAVGWMNLPIFGKKLSLDALLKTTIQSYSKSRQDFVEIGTVEAKISGEPAVGFRYSYTEQGAPLLSEHFFVKYNNQILTFILMSGTTVFERNHDDFIKFLTNVRFK